MWPWWVLSFRLQLPLSFSWLSSRRPLVLLCSGAGGRGSSAAAAARSCPLPSPDPSTTNRKMPALAAYPGAGKMACCLQLRLLRHPPPAPPPARVLLLLSPPRLRTVRASPGSPSANSFAGWSSDADADDQSPLGFGPAGGESHSFDSSSSPYSSIPSRQHLHLGRSIELFQVSAPPPQGF